MVENSEVQLTNSLADMLGDDYETVQGRLNAFFTWMIEKGKDPAQYEPMSEATAESYIKRLDMVQRDVIQYFEPDGVPDITDDHADEILRMLAEDELKKRGGEPYSDSAKRKFSNAIQKLLEWKFHTGQMNYEWRPRIKFSQSNHDSAAKFSYGELGTLFETARAYNALPSYYTSSPEERERINGLIAQRLGKKKEEITREDWLRADQSPKIGSLVLTGYDAGLAPKEVQNAELSWYDPDRQVLHIPTEQATKNREKEEVGLSDETCEALDKWVQVRRHLPLYDGTGKLWLNQRANPYSSGSLCNLVRKLCDEAGISTQNREIRWYSLRHTSGQNVSSEGSLAEANDQLRHKSFETTQATYNESHVEELKNTLNKTHEKASRAANDPDYNPYSEEEPSQNVDSRITVKETSSEEIVTSTSDGSVHIDAVIQDTTQERVDITRKILPDGES